MKMLALAAAVMFVGSMAVAADKAEEKATTDTSKNPVTGTVTTTKTVKDEGKDAAGNSHDVSAKEKTKHMKNGKMKKETNVKAEETTAPAAGK